MIMPATAPTLAVVVLSVGAPADLRGAVRSLVTQVPQPAEIVVVNSGGGDPSGRVRHLLADEAVFHTDTLLRHGATRNVGITATRASHVSFLSADCRARPGWVAGRLAAHAAGAAAVGSALVNRFPDSAAATAAHMILYSRRMPRAEPHQVLRYGASYDRALFDQFGGFDESLDGGEDTQFHNRLNRGGVAIGWAPDVVTEHPNPRTVRALAREQLWRGRRMTRFQVGQGMSHSQVLARVLGRTPADLARAWRSATPDDYPMMVAATPLTALALGAYTVGCITAHPTPLRRRA